MARKKTNTCDVCGSEIGEGEPKFYMGKNGVTWPVIAIKTYGSVERVERLLERAKEFGCPGNLRLANYIDYLEGRLESLEEDRRSKD